MIAALEVSPTMARCVSRSLLLLYMSLFEVSALVHLLYKRPLELSPRPMPSVKPAPSATTFLSAPQISTPGTSGTIATWNSGSLNTCYCCYYCVIVIIIVIIVDIIIGTSRIIATWKCGSLTWKSGSFSTHYYYYYYYYYYCYYY